MAEKQSQSEKLRQAGRDLECDEDEGRRNERLRQAATPESGKLPHTGGNETVGSQTAKVADTSSDPIGPSPNVQPPVPRSKSR